MHRHKKARKILIANTGYNPTTNDAKPTSNYRPETHRSGIISSMQACNLEAPTYPHLRKLFASPSFTRAQAFIPRICLFYFVTDSWEMGPTFLREEQGMEDDANAVLLYDGLHELASHARDRGLDLFARHVREEGSDAVLGAVEEHRVRDGDGDGDAGDLGAADESDGAGDFVGLDGALGHGEGGLAEGADADAEDDGVAVDLGGGGGGVDGVHEGRADDVEDAAAEVPGHVVAVFGEDGAVDDAGEDHEEDIGQDADAGLKGGVALGELEEEGDPGLG
ncbi:hypothetical protein V492_02495 [Pseudogymnoascus sp. VKM F-4246]|nr:hypothetical protein V492_02495 [Pseudogymnoascus sp. VKM F-4246]